MASSHRSSAQGFFSRIFRHLLSCLQAGQGVQAGVGLQVPSSSAQLANTTLANAISSGQLAGILNANGPPANHLMSTAQP